MKKTITIKNALIEDGEYLKNLSTSMDKSAADVLTHVINLAKTAKTGEETAENEAKTSKLERAVRALDADKTALLEELNQITEENRRLDGLLGEVNGQATTDAEKIQVQADRIKQLEKQLNEIQNRPRVVQLTGAQFVCDLSPENVLNVRRVRTFAKNEGFVSKEADGVEYVNEYVNAAIKAFNKRHFSDIIE